MGTGRWVRLAWRLMSVALLVPAAIVGSSPWWMASAFGIPSMLLWQPVPGLIVESAVRETRTDDGLQFGPGIVYRYEFEGRSFANNRVSIYDRFEADRSSAEALVQEFPAGAAVDVLANPARPNQSILRHSRLLEALVVLVLPLLLFILSRWCWHRGRH